MMEDHVKKPCNSVGAGFPRPNLYFLFMVNSIITYTLSMHNHPPLSPRTPYPPYPPASRGRGDGSPQAVGKASGARAGGRGGGIGIIGIENPSHSALIIVTFTILGLTHFSTVGAGQDAPPTVGCVSPVYISRSYAVERQVSVVRRFIAAPINRDSKQQDIPTHAR